MVYLFLQDFTHRLCTCNPFSVFMCLRDCLFMYDLWIARNGDPCSSRCKNKTGLLFL